MLKKLQIIYRAKNNVVIESLSLGDCHFLACFMSQLAELELCRGVRPSPKRRLLFMTLLIVLTCSAHSDPKW